VTSDHVKVFSDAAAGLEKALKALDEQPGYHPALGHLGTYRSALLDTISKLRAVVFALPSEPVVMENASAQS
jgi:hypothetical protein